ncbi:MAG TPA: class I SAM-dependent methyltransferase [Candidatus Acidoferrum sp.]|nr:class I SAM-dependent methyltransferase [Candidatus Acidoferrum sp.]
METVACNLCGSERCTTVYTMPDRLFPAAEMFTVVECAECGLGFVNPRPTVSEMQKYYPPEYFSASASKNSERYFQRRFAAEAKYLETIVPSGKVKRLLDVGCATGEFPRFMAARGWEVEGVEVSVAAREISDFRVYTEEFQRIPVNEPYYDAVTAWAVLEHVHDPMAYFRKAARVLKPGGFFVFLVTNFQSAASRHLFCEDVPRHLYFFTRETVERYLRDSGFELLKERNGRDVYKLAPNNWLAFMVRTKLLGRHYSFQDVPMTSKEFRRSRNLPKELRSALRYAAYSPLSVLDRMLWPVVESVQILRQNYGISTYVARKLGR